MYPRRWRRPSCTVRSRMLRLVAAMGLIGPVLACTGSARASGTVVIASGADLESANPLTTVHPLARQVQRYALFTTLARFDSLLAPQPYLAKHWSWSPDRRTLTLALYSGLRWHDGQLTTAQDVAFTIDAARDPATGSPRAADLAGVERVEVLNDSTVALHFRSAPPAFPTILCELPIAPAHLLARVPRSDLRRADFAFAPVGNGPFRFVRRDAGRRWVFDRVANFPSELGGPARLEHFVVAVVDDPTTKFAGLVSGDLDMAGISPTMAALVQRDPALRLVTYPIAFSTVVIFNAAQAPFDDVRVRRAVDAYIDRQRIIEAALAGFGAPAQGPVPSDHPMHVDAPRITAAAADSLLDAAGWRAANGGVRQRGGKSLGFTLLTVGSGDNAIEQLLQADLRTHGIVMEIRQLELGAFLAAARARPKRFDALITGITGDIALSYLVAMFSSKLAGGTIDYAGYHTPALDALLEQTVIAENDVALGSAWRDIQLELARQVPASWIYHSRGVQGLSGRLSGVRMDLRGELVSLTSWRTAGQVSRATP